MWGGLFQSRRFWAALTGIAVVIAQETVLGQYITEEQVNTISQLLMAWILGDSLQKTLPKGAQANPLAVSSGQPSK